MSLTRLAVARPLTVLMALLGLVIMGGVGYTYLKIDRLPPISIPFVSVQVAYTGATAQDVELLVTQPIENVVAGMPGAVSITSTSNEGSSSVNVHYAKLAAYGVTVAQVQTAMTNANVNAPVGSLDQGATTLNVRSLGAFQTLNDLGELVVTQTTTGGPILLHDLATISQGYKQQTQLQRLNGTDAVGLSIVKQSDANALQVADGSRVALAK